MAKNLCLAYEGEPFKMIADELIHANGMGKDGS